MIERIAEKIAEFFGAEGWEESESYFTIVLWCTRISFLGAILLLVALVVFASTDLVCIAGALLVMPWVVFIFVVAFGDQEVNW